VARASDTRSAYDGLAAWYLPVAIAVFAVVLGVLVVVAIRFRSSRRGEPSTRQTSTRLELSYAIGLGLIAGVLLWRSYEAISDVDPIPAVAAAAPKAGRAGLTVRVTAARWNWRFTYPGGVAQVGNGRARYPVLVVPAGEPVRFRMTSLDVVHAFWVPALRAKYDAIPGRVNVFDLEFARGLDYSTGRCSEFCGEYHDQMQFRVDVRPPAAFDAWLRDRQAQVGGRT
jgi:cytochrome c oxidase subunit 2